MHANDTIRLNEHFSLIAKMGVFGELKQVEIDRALMILHALWNIFLGDIKCAFSAS